MEEAEALSNTVGVMVGGRLVTIGTQQELKVIYPLSPTELRTHARTHAHSQLHPLLLSVRPPSPISYLRLVLQFLFTLVATALLG